MRRLYIMAVMAMITLSSAAQKFESKTLKADTMRLYGPDYFYKLYVDNLNLVTDGPFYILDTPAVAITAPVDTDTFNTVVPLSVVANYTPVTIDSIVYFVDGARQGNSANLGMLAAGNRELKVVVWHRGISARDSVSIYVKLLQPPTVAITAPADSVEYLNAAVSLAANVSAGRDSMEFYLDDVKIDTGTSLNYGILKGGFHELKVIAWNDGLKAVDSVNVKEMTCFFAMGAQGQSNQASDEVATINTQARKGIYQFKRDYTIELIDGNFPLDFKNAKAGTITPTYHASTILQDSLDEHFADSVAIIILPFAVPGEHFGQGLYPYSGDEWLQNTGMANALLAGAIPVVDWVNYWNGGEQDVITSSWWSKERRNIEIYAWNFMELTERYDQKWVFGPLPDQWVQAYADEIIAGKNTNKADTVQTAFTEPKSWPRTAQFFISGLTVVDGNIHYNDTSSYIIGQNYAKQTPVARDNVPAYADPPACWVNMSGVLAGTNYWPAGPEWNNVKMPFNSNGVKDASLHNVMLKPMPGVTLTLVSGAQFPLFQNDTNDAAWNHFDKLTEEIPNAISKTGASKTNGNMVWRLSGLTPLDSVTVKIYATYHSSTFGVSKSFEVNGDGGSIANVVDNPDQFAVIPTQVDASGNLDITMILAGPATFMQGFQVFDID